MIAAPHDWQPGRAARGELQGMRFHDCRDAGQQLAARLGIYSGRSDVVILGLPRGGVSVAYEVAQKLGAPFDVFLVRKLGVPGHPELAMGAIVSGASHLFEEPGTLDRVAQLAGDWFVLHFSAVGQQAVRESGAGGRP